MIAAQAGEGTVLLVGMPLEQGCHRSKFCWLGCHWSKFCWLGCHWSKDATGARMM